nr:hypothetical protein [Tanacetum cinerariifolium]
MVQTQRQADVHQDELCQPKKCYALMDANKKIDIDNPLCPNENKIMANILQNHPLRFSIATSSVPWIYLGQFWHTLKEDGSNKTKCRKVKENLITEEIDKLVKGTNNVENSKGFNYFLNNQEVPSTRLEPMSNKESPEVGKTDVVSQRVNVIEEEEESPEDNYELRRREKCKNEVMKESLPKMLDDHVDSSVRNYMSNHKLRVHPTQETQASSQYLQYQLYLTMKDNLQLQHDDLPIWLALKLSLKDFKVLILLVKLFPFTQEIRTILTIMLILRGRIVLKGIRLLSMEPMKEILVLPFPQKSTQVVQSCQRDPKAPALSIVNQDLYYLMKGNSRPQKIVLSLHKFPEVFFPDDDIKERTSKWVDKYVMKFNRNKQKFLIELIATRENGSIVSITESDYKNSKKEKRVMRHQEIHKFYDVTLKRVLEGLKRYNNNVKHGYVTPSLNKGDVEYLQLFKEEIEERLKHRD